MRRHSDTGVQCWPLLCEASTSHCCVSSKIQLLWSYCRLEWLGYSNQTWSVLISSGFSYPNVVPQNGIKQTVHAALWWPLWQLLARTELERSLDCRASVKHVQFPKHISYISNKKPKKRIALYISYFDSPTSITTCWNQLKQRQLAFSVTYKINKTTIIGNAELL